GDLIADLELQGQLAQRVVEHHVVSVGVGGAQGASLGHDAIIIALLRDLTAGQIVTLQSAEVKDRQTRGNTVEAELVATSQARGQRLTVDLHRLRPQGYLVDFPLPDAAKPVQGTIESVLVLRRRHGQDVVANVVDNEAADAVADPLAEDDDEADHEDAD